MGLSTDDAELAEQWAALGDLPAGTLGRGVWEFYTARGFTFPGLAGSAPPLLAQHDWVHVLAGYGSTLEAELEVFAFIARANDRPEGFSLLAMVVSLFETGALEPRHGHVRRRARPAVARRDGDARRRRHAPRRPAATASTGPPPTSTCSASTGSRWPTSPISELRERFAIGPKSAAAVAAGSAEPFEPGGISEYQWTTTKAAAEARGDVYDSFGATPPPG